MKPFTSPRCTFLGTLSLVTGLALLASGCSKQEQRQAEHTLKEVGNTTVSVAKKGSKTALNALDKAADTTTDAAITGSVKTQLLADKWVGASKIDVTTKNHIVTLTGKVPSPQQRVRASKLTKDVVGVHGVENKLGVGK